MDLEPSVRERSDHYPSGLAGAKARSASSGASTYSNPRREFRKRIVSCRNTASARDTTSWARPIAARFAPVVS